MILSLFILFNGLALCVLLVGYLMDAAALKYISFTLFFLLGSVFIFNSLEIPDTKTITAVGDTQTIATTYTVYENHTFAF